MASPFEDFFRALFSRAGASVPQSLAYSDRGQDVTRGRIANDANSRGQLYPDPPVRGIAEFEGTNTPQLPQNGVTDPWLWNPWTWDNQGDRGVPLETGGEIRPSSSFIDIGGLFGSNVSRPVLDPDSGRSFNLFLDELKQLGKNLDGSRSMNDLDPFLLARTRDSIEHSLASLPIDYNIPGLNDPISHPRGSYYGRHEGDNEFLTPEQRAQADDEFYAANPELVTPSGNRLPKDLPQEVRDAIKRSKLPWYMKDISY